MRNFKFIALIMAISILLVACGGAGKSAPTSESMPQDVRNDMSVEAPAESIEMEQELSDIVTQGDETRKIIVTYNLELDTKKYTEGINKINELLRANGGYTLSLNESAYGTRYVSMVLKVPKDNAEDFVNGIAGVETINLISRNMESSDVTSSYTDNELRLKTQREKLDRLYELQKDQTNLETLLQLETEISNTIYEIESIEMTLSNLDARIDYSTINIQLREVSATSTTYTRLPFLERIGDAFGDSLESFVWFIEGFIIALIYFMPYLIMIILLVVILTYIYRKVFKNRNKIGIKNSTKISDMFEKKDEPDKKI